MVRSYGCKYSIANHSVVFKCLIWQLVPLVPGLLRKMKENIYSEYDI